MAEITEETLAELERLDREAMPGPWSWEQTGDKDNSWCVGVSCDQEGSAVAGLIEEEFDDEAHEFLPKPDVIEFICENGNDGTFSDAALLVALRNAAPQLIAAARRSLELTELFDSLSLIIEDTGECPFCNYPDGERHDADCPIKATEDRLPK